MPGSFDALTIQQQQLLEQAQAVTYRKPAGGGELRIHFYLPKGLKEGPKCPVFLFFNSGNFDRGNVIQFAPQALYFVDRGAVCGLVEYRTSESHTDATPMDAALDALCAVRFTRHYEDQLHVDGEKITVVGAGAGANIAGLTSLGAKFKDFANDYVDFSSVPNAAVLFSSLIDINRKSFAYRQFAGRSSEARKMSLSNHVDNCPKCPTIMIHGTADRVVSIDDAEAFSAKMKRRMRKDFEFHPFEGRDANFYNLNMDPVSFEASLNLSDRFLVKHDILEPNDDPHGASLVSWREEDF